MKSNLNVKQCSTLSPEWQTEIRCHLPAKPAFLSRYPGRRSNGTCHFVIPALRYLCYTVSSSFLPMEEFIMNNLIFSLNSTLPIFFIMVIGYILGQKKFLSGEFCSMADKLVFRVGLPCMLFCDMTSIDLTKDFDGKFVLFCFISTAVFITVLWILARLFLTDKNLVGEFVQASYRSSAAIMGVAFIQNIYGTSGMAPLMILGSVPLFNIFAVLILTLENPSHKDGINLKSILKGLITNPILDGIVLGSIYNLLPIGLPAMAQKTLSTLGSLTTPLALISIGASFEGAKAIKKLRPTIAASLCKLMFLNMIFLPLAIWFGFRGQELVALLIMLGTPTTPASYIMAKNMGHDGTLSASCVAATTFFSAVTITLWLFLLSTGGFLA